MIILTILASLGLFLYGLQHMSEGLQKIAGDSLRNVQTALTGRRVKGVLSGMAITALVQSSSVTTLMAVSFVNAGIFSLAESMAVIMGANVGTTATTWIVTLLGFQLGLTAYALVPLAVSMPFLNAQRPTQKAIGEFLMGFGLLFLGIHVLTDQLPALAALPGLQEFLSRCSGLGFGSVVIFLLVGVLFTLLVQTSSATFTVAALLCGSRLIGFDDGCALILGANIGTCIVPLIATRSASIVARQAALGHLLFNVFGLVWSLAVFDGFCHVIARCSLALDFTSGFGAGVILDLALFHTAFNFVNLCLLFPLTRPFVWVITRLIPYRRQHHESFKLQYIDGNFLPSSGEMALVQVQKEVRRYALDTHRMFQMIRQMLHEPMGTERQLQLMQQVNHMEEQSDKAELEIARFLNEISPQTLSASGEQLCQSLYKIVDELESIADAIRHCSEALFQKSEHRIRFTAQMNANIDHMIALTDDAMSHMTHVLQLDEMPGNALNKAYNYEDEINNYRNLMRNEMLDFIDRNEIEYEQNTYFMLLINECEKIGDYVINVVAAASD